MLFIKFFHHLLGPARGYTTVNCPRTMFIPQWNVYLPGVVGVNSMTFSPGWRRLLMPNSGKSIVLVHPDTFVPSTIHLTGTPALTVNAAGSYA